MTRVLGMISSGITQTFCSRKFCMPLNFLDVPLGVTWKMIYYHETHIWIKDFRMQMWFQHTMPGGLYRIYCYVKLPGVRSNWPHNLSDTCSYYCLPPHMIWKCFRRLNWDDKRVESVRAKRLGSIVSTVMICVYFIHFSAKHIPPPHCKYSLLTLYHRYYVYVMGATQPDRYICSIQYFLMLCI